MWRIGKVENYVKKLIFGQMCMKFYHGNIKNRGHATDISKCPKWMKEQVLKVSASVLLSLFVQLLSKMRNIAIYNHSDEKKTETHDF